MEHVVEWLSYADPIVKYGQLITAVVAACAVTIAVISIVVQKRLARRRAAIDFFLRTELDKELLNNYTTFNAALDKVSTYSSIEEMAKEGAADGKSTTYKDICLYLSVHELMALGVRNEVFDEKICYRFWANVLAAAVDQAGPVIKYVRGQPYCSDTYSDLLALNERWCRRRFWQLWKRKPTTSTRPPTLGLTAPVR